MSPWQSQLFTVQKIIHQDNGKWLSVVSAIHLASQLGSPLLLDFYVFQSLETINICNQFQDLRRQSERQTLCVLIVIGHDYNLRLWSNRCVPKSVDIDLIFNVPAKGLVYNLVGN